VPIIQTKKANEESTYVVVVKFYDEEGDPVIPTSIAWSLTDSAATAINSRTAVSVSPAASINIVLSGDDLALASSDRKRILYINAAYTSSYGTGLPLREEIVFEIEPLTNVT
jgi:hypothetical protein